MKIIENKTTLFDNLEEIIGNTDEDELKKNLLILSKIYKFKNLMKKYLSNKIFYKRLFSQFQEEFTITKFKVVYMSDDQRVVLFKSGERLEYDFVFEYNIFNDINISIFIEDTSFSNVQLIILNTYFKELVDLIYMQFSLSNLEKSITIDPLTKLQNRISFNTEMKTLVPLARREKMKFGVLLINIDRFRAVNDEHGDEFGDNFLKLYAKTIKKNIRTSDIAVRFSGGEFLVLLVNVESEEMTIKIAEKIQDRLAQTYLISPNNDQFKKTVSVGVSMFPEDSSNINQVIKCAEMALSDAQAKGNGRNQLVRYKDIETGEGTVEFF
jgi:diguanylate cyclase (GGDEF)-like protein